MDKRCLLITYYFPPLGGGGVQRLLKLIKFASGQGWQFTVLTAEEQSGFVAEDPSLLTEIPEKTSIIRLPFKLPSTKQAKGNANYFKRWLSAFLFVPDSRKGWVQKAWQKLQSLNPDQQFDLVLISIPPYSLSMLANKIQSTWQIPVVLDLRDPWTLNPYKIHPTPFHRWLDAALEKRYLNSVQFGTSAYQRLIDYYVSHWADFKKENWCVIPNGFDEEDFIDLPATDSGKSSFFQIGFSGTIYSHLNHPTPLFKAMAKVKEKWPQQGAKLRFVHVGKSHIDLNKLAAQYGLENQVQSLGYLPHKEALAKLNEMDSLCFVLDDRDKRSRFTVGGKVYEYLRLNKPILALVPEEGEAADLIKTTNSGVVISPQKTEAIASLLHQWLNGENRKFNFENIENYRRDVQASKFVQFFDEILLKSKEISN